MTIWKLFKAKREVHAALNKFLFVAENAKREYAVVRLVRNIVILEVFGIVMYFIFSFKYAARPENIGMVVSIVVHTFLAFMIIFPPMIANKLQSLIVTIATPINKLRSLLRQIQTKLRRVVEAVRRQFRALANLTNLCKRFMKKPYAICKNFLEKMFIACVSKDNVISVPGCDIIKRSSSICETAGSAVEDNVCNFPSVAKSVIVNGYFFLIRKIFAVGTKTAEETLFFHIQTVKKTFKTVKTEVADIRQMDIKYHQADQGADDLTVHKKLQTSLQNVIHQYLVMFEMIQLIIKWIFIPVTLLWPFVSTLLFTYKFNYREEYKNTYLTEEFEKIDLDMALRGRTKALPLNKEEKLVNVFSPLTSDIRNRDETWRNCFVEPTPPNDDTRWTIILMFIAAIFLCRFQVWMSRQTLALADYFFPDRVRPRALMLYNRILMDRKNVLGAMMEQQKVRIE
ncbi:unnamed protein product [Nippostrongylus brasiliensis]|uniref:DC_STAMP domain-containing protein n=1 Tax=Nippostrongylus brasiliensis TaxID=27835 RepID=A0A0N4YMX6_NIPBR|nr:unnamed protein product [Nippostrongylus brasiliensis]